MTCNLWRSCEEGCTIDKVCVAWFDGEGVEEMVACGWHPCAAYQGASTERTDVVVKMIDDDIRCLHS